jgi:hypothetical protein
MGSKFQNQVVDWFKDGDNVDYKKLAIVGAGASLLAAAAFAVRNRKLLGLEARYVGQGLRNWWHGTTREQELLKHVLANAKKGDPESVLQAYDDFTRTKQLMMNIGDVKGPLLDQLMREKFPKVVLELGGYCGYSAVRILRLLGEGSRLITVEINPTFAVSFLESWWMHLLHKFSSSFIGYSPQGGGLRRAFQQAHSIGGSIARSDPQTTRNSYSPRFRFGIHRPR